MNYQELANENLFKHNFGVCVVMNRLQKVTYGRGFTAEIAIDPGNEQREINRVVYLRHDMAGHHDDAPAEMAPATILSCQLGRWYRQGNSGVNVIVMS